MTPQPSKRGRPKLSDARMNLERLLNSATDTSEKTRLDYLEELGHLKKPKRIWEQTRLCGCGLCRFHSPRKCAMAESPSATWLWSSDER